MKIIIQLQCKFYFLFSLFRILIRTCWPHNHLFTLIENRLKKMILSDVDRTSDSTNYGIRASVKVFNRKWDTTEIINI